MQYTDSYSLYSFINILKLYNLVFLRDTGSSKMEQTHHWAVLTVFMVQANAVWNFFEKKRRTGVVSVTWCFHSHNIPWVFITCICYSCATSSVPKALLTVFILIDNVLPTAGHPQVKNWASVSMSLSGEKIAQCWAGVAGKKNVPSAEPRGK